MGWLGRGLGDFGSQVGQGYDINLGWKERLQNMALQNARQKLEEMKAPLELQELQQRLAAMKRPQYQGTFGTPGGGISAITVDPLTGIPKTTALTPGINRDSVKSSIQQMAAGVNPQDRSVFEQYLRALDIGVDPLKVLEQANAYNASVSKVRQKGWQVKTDAGGQPTEAISPEGESYSAFDQNIPPDGAAIVKQYQTAYLQHLKDVQTAADAQSQRVLDRTLAAQDRRDRTAGQKQKESDATKAVTEAINAFNHYQSMGSAGQRVDLASHWYYPSTWGAPGEASARTQEALDDAEGKRLDAVRQLKEAGMAVPDWLTKPIGPQTEVPVVPPPPGPPVPGAQIRTVP